MADEDTGADAPDDDEIGNAVGREVGPDDNDDAPAEGSAPTVGRRERKPLNPALFAKFSTAVKKHLEGDDDEDAIAETGPAAKAATPAAAAPTPAADKPAEPPRAGPPPEAIAAWERVNLRAADLDARETKLKEREGRTRDVAGRFSADPLAAMRDLVRAELGDDATDDEVQDELGFLVTSVSLAFAGATVDPNNQAHDLKKLKRELRQQKAKTRKEGADAAAARTAADKKARTAAAVTQIGVEFEPLAQKYPWLAITEEPAALLFDVIKSEHERSGKVLDLEDAAKLANDHLGNADRTYFEKRKHLLQPPPALTPANVIAPQGDPLQRRSRALTIADASEDAPPAHDELGRPPSVEERRRKSIAKYRERLAAASRD
jgi:hypothetical protein